MKNKMNSNIKDTKRNVELKPAHNTQKQYFRNSGHLKRKKKLHYNKKKKTNNILLLRTRAKLFGLYRIGILLHYTNPFKINAY